MVDPVMMDFYHKGDGGTFKVYLEEDDGTSNYFPSGKVIGETFSLHWSSSAL